MLTLMRLFLDPTAVEGGGAAANADAAPNAAQHRTITAEEHQRLLKLETDFLLEQQRKAAEADKAESERLLLMAQKGEADKALDELRTQHAKRLQDEQSRYKQLETEVFSERRERAFAQAFAGRAFAGETVEDRAAAQADLVKLLADDFEVVRDAGGAILVREKETHRPATEALRERLDGRRYARYFASKGGGTPQPDARNLGGVGGGGGALEKNAADWKARQQGGMGLFRI